MHFYDIKNDLTWKDMKPVTIVRKSWRWENAGTYDHRASNPEKNSVLGI